MNNRLLKAIENDNLYDYVDDYNQELSREDMRTLVKELSYAVYSLRDRDITKKVNEIMIENLKEREGL